ncbi:hypothetical protein V6N13_043713 [Hibiscus sabdariffa]
MSMIEMYDIVDELRYSGRSRHIHVYLEEEVTTNVTTIEEGTEEAGNPYDSGSEEDPDYVVTEGGELHSASNLDFDDPKKKKKIKVPEFNTDVDMTNPQFKKE